VAATALVHGANNVLKVSLLGKHADRSLVLRFGVPAILAAFAGAAALGFVAHFEELARYQIGPRTAIVTPIKLVMGLLMFVFAMFELAPGLRELKFDRKYLTVGGPGSFTLGLPGQGGRIDRGFRGHQRGHRFHG